MAIDTGLGAALTAMPGSWTGAVTSIELHTTELPMVSTSHLGTTTNRTVMAGDLATPGSVTLELQFVPTTAPPVVGDAGTLTITDALQAGDVSAANYTGTARVSSVAHGDRVANELNMMSVTVEWTGVTGPTFAVAVVTPP